MIHFPFLTPYLYLSISSDLCKDLVMGHFSQLITSNNLFDAALAWSVSRCRVESGRRRGHDGVQRKLKPVKHYAHRNTVSLLTGEYHRGLEQEGAHQEMNDHIGTCWYDLLFCMWAWAGGSGCLIITFQSNKSFEVLMTLFTRWFWTCSMKTNQHDLATNYRLGYVTCSDFLDRLVLDRVGCRWKVSILMLIPRLQ